MRCHFAKRRTYSINGWQDCYRTAHVGGLQRTGQAAVTAETTAAETVFAREEAGPEVGERRVKRLYMKADGVYGRLQR